MELFSRFGGDLAVIKQRLVFTCVMRLKDEILEGGARKSAIVELKGFSNGLAGCGIIWNVAVWVIAKFKC